MNTLDTTAINDEEVEEKPKKGKSKKKKGLIAQVRERMRKGTLVTDGDSREEKDLVHSAEVPRKDLSESRSRVGDYV